MMIGLVSAKASPGVTTLAALVALQWPDPTRQRCIVEVDPAGGTLAARWQHLGLSTEPGLLSLAASRSPLDAAALERHGQLVADNVRVIAAPPSIAQTEAALESLGDRAGVDLAKA